MTRQVSLLVLAIAMFVIGAAVALLVSLFGQRHYPISATQVAEYERTMHLRFPPSTVVIGYGGDYGVRDPASYIRVQMNEGDFRRLYQASPFHGAPMDGSGDTYLDYPSESWWIPPDNISTVSIWIGERRGLGIGVTSARDGVVDVYLLLQSF